MPIKKKKAPVEVAQQQLFTDVQQLIEVAKSSVSQTVNAGLTMLYWNIGKRINEEVLQNERAAYGKQIIASLSKQLVAEYGGSYKEKNLRRIVQFYKIFPDFEIVASLMRQLSWTHFTLLLPISNDLQRTFTLKCVKLKNGM